MKALIVSISPISSAYTNGVLLVLSRYFQASKLFSKITLTLRGRLLRAAKWRGVFFYVLTS
jgi:hypothetical protein